MITNHRVENATIGFYKFCFRQSLVFNNLEPVLVDNYKFLKFKKTYKIIVGVVIFFTLPTLLLFCFLYFKYHEPLPNGSKGKQADDLAAKMLVAINYEAFIATDVFEWTFKNRRHYKWEKRKNICEVYWEQYKISLDLNDSRQHKAYVHSFKVDGDLAEKLIKKAIKYYENDSFWVFAPYRVFDEGVKRELIKDDLLVTYTNGDSYLWNLDNDGMPISFKMWTSEFPIDGLEVLWSNWKTTETGAKLPTLIKLFIFGTEISDIKGTS
ncbi:hypothetical protein [Seonamhaeicola aphaedonensis]|uniref:Uncharacterized protein n=1 Tax=Seonamhaeicola aphaedonensis TaxID=1461338 RepID=A0A3D9HIE5_9FLAO|nr:hypothetical protein [Seonamhaeicola aphaedonensis]RED49289.1 hypothetical protein DFQ02_10251 [Seonamhaeicola aphaedonensis]